MDDQRIRRFPWKPVLAIVGIAVAVLAVIVAWVVLYRMNTVTYGEYKLYRYFAGRKMEYANTVAFAYDGSIKNLTYSGGEEVNGAVPFYFTDNNDKALLAESMELVIPRIRNQNYRTIRLSTVETTQGVENASAFLSIKGKNVYLEPSFLYDGNDLYFFPYATTLTVGGQTYELSPLSYVDANYGGDVEIYDKASDTMTILENCSETIMAGVGGYKINLTADMLFYSDTETRLLMKNYADFLIYEG